MKKKLLALSLLCAMIISMVAPSLAQTSGTGTPLVTQRFSISAPGASPFLVLTNGQSNCSVTVLNTTSFTGLTMIAQAASDGPYTPVSWNEVTALDNGGITAVGTYTHNIASSGITDFRVNVTGLSSGTVTGVIACNSSVGGGASFNVSGPQAPTYTPTQRNIGANAGQAVISYPYLWNQSLGQFDQPAFDPSDVQETTNGGTHLFRISSTSATACTNVAAGTGRVVKIWNSGPATTIYPQFYDEATAACSSADILWGDGASLVIPSGASILSFDAPLQHGLTYHLSGALSSSQTIVISTYGLGF